MNTPYAPLAYWSGPIVGTKEKWYNTPGTSPYELNTNVSVPQGPSWGPKARLSMLQNLATKQWIFIGMGILVIICLFVIFHPRYSRS